jgi:hypothetical protein
MSRSYHVTEKAARRAFAEGDTKPTLDASEKSWVKKAAERKRQRSGAARRRPSNRAIVSEEKSRTQRVREKLAAKAI